MTTDLEKITPPKDLSNEQKGLVFEHFFRRLASYRNTAAIYAVLECATAPSADSSAMTAQDEFEAVLNAWGQSLLEKAWIVCYGDNIGELLLDYT